MPGPRGYHCPECDTFVPLKTLEVVPTTLKCQQCGAPITAADIEQQTTIENTIFYGLALAIVFFVFLAQSCGRH
jgi:uncharacterized paraquat-inducible protein A